jgi:hypothetical protein
VIAQSGRDVRLGNLASLTAPPARPVDQIQLATGKRRRRPGHHVVREPEPDRTGLIEPLDILRRQLDVE